jgi:MFS family permease
VATFGNGLALICNQLLVQRGAPDAMRGRALALLFSTFYATLGIGMVAAGLLTDAVGGRRMWAIAAGVYLVGAVVAFAMTRRLEVVAPPEPSAEGASRVLFRELAERRRADGAAEPSSLAMRSRPARPSPAVPEPPST